MPASLIRPLVLPVAAAATLTALLIWSIRAAPIEITTSLQIVLSVVLVVVAGLLVCLAHHHAPGRPVRDTVQDAHDAPESRRRG